MKVETDLSAGFAKSSELHDPGRELSASGSLDPTPRTSVPADPPLCPIFGLSYGVKFRPANKDPLSRGRKMLMLSDQQPYLHFLWLVTTH